MTTPIRYSNGRATVKTDGVLEAAIRNMLNKYAPTITETLERDVTEVTEGARKRWPRKSGDSAIALESYIFIKGNTIGAAIENPIRKQGVGYAYLIKSGKVGRTKKGRPRRPWDVLVLRPLKKRRKKMARELAHEIASLIKV